MPLGAGVGDQIWEPVSAGWAVEPGGADHRGQHQAAAGGVAGAVEPRLTLAAFSGSRGLQGKINQE